MLPAIPLIQGGAKCSRCTRLVWHTRQRGQTRRGLLLLVLALTALAILSGIGWYKWIRPEFYARNFGDVEPGAIYRSGQNSPRVLRELCEEHGIRTIIDLGGARGPNDATEAERRLAAELGIERYEFLFPADGTGNPNKYVQVLSLMADPDKQPVLVHCAAGAQRTSTAVILYRTVVEGMSVTQAYPESFDFKHEPDEWILLAHIADNLPHIREAFRRQSADREHRRADKFRK